MLQGGPSSKGHVPGRTWKHEGFVIGRIVMHEGYVLGWTVLYSEAFDDESLMRMHRSLCRKECIFALVCDFLPKIRLEL